MTTPARIPGIMPPEITFTIAVGGSMNPAIHHPLWYRTIGAIDDAEYEESIKLPLSTTQLLSQLRFGNPELVIQCQLNEWTIQGFSDDSWSRMVKIVELVFARLNETPVGAYSLVTEKHLDTKISNVKSALAERIYGMNLAHPRGDKVITTNIELTTAMAEFRIRTALQPSVRGADKLYVFYQHQYFAPQEPVYFDLGKLVTPRVNEFCEAQTAYCKNVVSALGE